MGGDHFAYDAAFSRNIGWVTEAEQATLRRKRIAIAGMGGVGGGHLLTLARLGIGAFLDAQLLVDGGEGEHGPSVRGGAPGGRGARRRR